MARMSSKNVRAKWLWPVGVVKAGACAQWLWQEGMYGAMVKAVSRSVAVAVNVDANVAMAKAGVVGGFAVKVVNDTIAVFGPGVTAKTKAELMNSILWLRLSVSHPHAHMHPVDKVSFTCA